MNCCAFDSTFLPYGIVRFPKEAVLKLGGHFCSLPADLIHLHTSQGSPLTASLVTRQHPRDAHYCRRNHYVPFDPHTPLYPSRDLRSHSPVLGPSVCLTTPADMQSPQTLRRNQGVGIFGLDGLMERSALVCKKEIRLTVQRKQIPCLRP